MRSETLLYNGVWLTWDDSELTPRDLTTGKRHETQSHPRSVKYYCITAFHYALSIRKINSTVELKMPSWKDEDIIDYKCVIVYLNVFKIHKTRLLKKSFFLGLIVKRHLIEFSK